VKVNAVDILGKARKLESRIARTVDRAAQHVLKPDGREPLEIMHALVDAVEEEVQPAGRDTHVFPFNRIKVSVVAPTREARARLEAVFDGEPTLQERIAQCLESAGCAAAPVVVKVVYVGEAKPEWPSREYHVDFDRLAVTAPAPEPARPAISRLRLVVVAGTAEQSQYSFAMARIDLGRCAEVRDQRRRLLRTNHVAFADTDAPPNRSVSRRHAHIRYAADVREFRLYDDRSEQGTGVLRSGRTIAVPPGSRGVRLQSGDEIVLGEARLRVAIGEVS
jgi:hypothetical protein